MWESLSFKLNKCPFSTLSVELFFSTFVLWRKKGSCTELKMAAIDVPPIHSHGRRTFFGHLLTVPANLGLKTRHNVLAIHR